MNALAPKNILVIRTDNIGDLVCTTPLLAALRGRWPQAWIGVLTNSYSAPAVQGHPAIDAVIVYQKAKHLDAGESVLKAHWRRLRTVLVLRRRGIDLVLIPATAGQDSAQRFARLIGAKTVLVNRDSAAAHEVEKVYALGAQLPAPTLPAEIPPCTVFAQPDRRQYWEARWQSAFPKTEQGSIPVRVGLHISARKPSQRWPAERFVALAKRLHRECGAQFLLFWSPGSEDDPRHPGDDTKAAQILQGIGSDVVFPVPTDELPDLIAGLSLCDVVIQSDGGAMHLAAALGKAIVCFFGNSEAARWHPWGVPYELLQPESRDVADISVDDAVAAFVRLVRLLPVRPDADFGDQRHA